MDTIKTIAEFGIMTALSGLVVWSLYKFLGTLHLWVNLKIKKNYNYIDDSITHEELSRRNKNIRNAEDKLLLLLEQTKANRAYIYTFHNGTTYYTGEHDLKASTQVEAVKEAKPMKHQKQNLQINLFPDLVHDLLSQKTVYRNFTRVFQAGLLETTAAVFSKWHDTKYWIAAPIIIRNKYYGLIALDFTTIEQGACFNDEKCLAKVQQITADFASDTGVRFIRNELHED